MKNPNDHNLFSLREAAKLTGKSYHTLCIYIDQRKIEFLQIDHLRVITQDEIDRIVRDGIIPEPKHKLDGYKTIIQAARILNIKTHSLKTYVMGERIDYIKKYDTYFISDETISEWLKVPAPRNPNTVESYYMDAITIRETAKVLMVSDSSIRKLILDGQLNTVDGFCRRYVTKGCIAKYIEVQEMIKEL